MILVTRLLGTESPLCCVHVCVCLPLACTPSGRCLCLCCCCAFCQWRNPAGRQKIVELRFHRSVQKICSTSAGGRWTRRRLGSVPTTSGFTIAPFDFLPSVVHQELRLTMDTDFAATRQRYPIPINLMLLEIL